MSDGRVANVISVKATALAFSTTQNFRRWSMVFLDHLGVVLSIAKNRDHNVSHCSLAISFACSRSSRATSTLSATAVTMRFCRFGARSEKLTRALEPTEGGEEDGVKEDELDLHLLIFCFASWVRLCGCLGHEA